MLKKMRLPPRDKNLIPFLNDVFPSNLHRHLRQCDDGQTCTLARVGLATMDMR